MSRPLAALADGLTQKQACVASGVSESALRTWREQRPELEQRMAEAREQARQKALAGIKAAGEAGDWRASEAFLRLSFQEDYRRNAAINVTATATNQQALVVDEATRQRLMELREKILRDQRESEPQLPADPNGKVEVLKADSNPAACGREAAPEPPVDERIEKLQQELEEMKKQKLEWEHHALRLHQENQALTGSEPWGDGNHPAMRRLGQGPK